MAAKCPKLKLSDGTDMPLVGLGTYKSKPGEVYDAVSTAIDVGYRHIDCALFYENENEIGRAIRDKIKAGVVTRDELYIVSKNWNTHRSPELVKKYFEKSLNDLCGDYLDLYLIHWPFSWKSGDALTPLDADGKPIESDIDYVDVWKAFEQLQQSGKVKSIGVSNFNSEQISRLLENCTIKPVINQVECHPYLNQEKLLQFCEARGIKLTAYRPLGLSTEVPNVPLTIKHPEILSIAEAHNVTPVQVVVRFQLQRGVAVIPKSSNKDRIKTNFDVFDFSLTETEMNTILGLKNKHRIVSLDNMKSLKYYPFNIEF